MNSIKKMAGAIGRSVYHALRTIILKLAGFRLLNPKQTIAFMAPYELKAIAGNKTTLPPVINCADNKTEVFPQKNINADTVYVWDHKDGAKKAALSKYGSVTIRKNVLSTDWNYNSFYMGLRQADKRENKTVVTAIALFSQFQDGVMYGGYYDFVFLVAAKLSRIKDALPEKEFAAMAVTYPLFNSGYEKEYLQMLDVDAENVIDTTKFKVDPLRLITGNSAHWYPNAADIASLKENISKKFKPEQTAPKRVYISRKGRRCVTNEAELVEMLKILGFTIIEDKPRSVTEQIEIYYNASFILGPHGASFSNIIWCRPGTHLMELFSGNYVPDFFLYLANITGMKYSAYYEDAPQKINHIDALVEDIHVSVPQLKACLEGIFNQE
jgi:capsular polysaccharide biosynthesis protein